MIRTGDWCPAVWVIVLALAVAPVSKASDAVRNEIAPLVLEPAVGSESVARAVALRDRFSPPVLEQTLVGEPLLTVAVLRLLADAVATAEVEDAGELAAYAVALARERAWRLDGRGGRWRRDEVEQIVSMLLIDRRRFVRDEEFRARVLPHLVVGLEPATSPEPCAQVIALLEAQAGVGFDRLEEMATRCGAVARASLGRRQAVETGTLRPTMSRRQIGASIFVLPSRFFAFDEARAFLESVQRMAPSRSLVVLTDGELYARLEPMAALLNVSLIDTFAVPLSPWPRDPVSLFTREDGGYHVLLRPNAQPMREQDAMIGRSLVQGVPPLLDRSWGGLSWSWSPVPFHNGQMLFTPGRVWLSLHTLEEEILRRVGVDRIPVERFGDPVEVERFLVAARLAAREIERLLGTPVSFVHDLPAPNDPDALMRLGGGGGYDLDSLVTLLPTEGGEMVALVGDLDAGAGLIAQADGAELEAWGGVWSMNGGGERLRRAVVAAQRSEPAARALQTYLDVVAGDLARQMVVHRLPLLRLPMALRGAAGAAAEADAFLIGWHNVVLERLPGEHRAEGFASALPSGDRLATDRFAAAGYRLDLVPPLVESVVRNGGYRCASQHVRVGPER